MNEMNLLEGLQGPVSQSVDAVKALLTWKGRAVDPLPPVVEFTHEGEEGRLMLVLSNKKDSYYVTTSANCSCPARTYNPGQPCKHQRKHFGAKVAAPEVTASESLIERGGFNRLSHKIYETDFGTREAWSAYQSIFTVEA
jgi:hypothetical protein